MLKGLFTINGIYLLTAFFMPQNAQAIIKDIVPSTPYRFSTLLRSQPPTPDQINQLAQHFCRVSGYDRSISHQIGVVRSGVYDYFYTLSIDNELPEPHPLPPVLSRQANGQPPSREVEREVFTSLVCEGSELIAALKQWAGAQEAITWLENFNGRNQSQFKNLNQLAQPFSATFVYNQRGMRAYSGYVRPVTAPQIDATKPENPHTSGSARSTP
jgi:hypothetical protein